MTPLGTWERGRCGSCSGRGGHRAAWGPKQGKDYATLHGQRHGWYGSKEDVIQPSKSQAMPDISRDSPGKGLFIYIQTTTICHCLIMSQIFENAKAPVRQQATKRGLIVPVIRLALYEWQCNIKKTHYSHTAFSSQAILNDDTCERLASIGPISSKHFLHQQLCG
ncbi:hypothetical protein B0H13DRAFT_1931735 [Mycena leptocephala]|nr:hypothetical protein B0H13DRAFT_1931735 [Mycena leptocephala]